AAAGAAPRAGGGRAAGAVAAGTDARAARDAVDAAGRVGRLVRRGLVRPAPARAARHRRRHRDPPAGLSFTLRSAQTGFNPPMPAPRPAESRSDAELIRANRGFYESLWAGAKLV